MGDLKKIISIFIIFSSLSIFIYANDELTAFEKGEQLFLNNDPYNAAPLLEKALLQDSGNEKIYLYLGIIYEQTGNNRKAIEILKSGLDSAFDKKDRFYFNLGNNHFILGEYQFAEEMYSEALLRNSSLYIAYLNRANTRVNLKSYTNAVTDYKAYLTLNPDAEQRDKIEKVIDLLIDISAAEELERQQEEQRQREEAEKQRVLLENVLNSLNTASEDTINLSAESEDIEESDDDSDIED